MSKTIASAARYDLAIIGNGAAAFAAAIRADEMKKRVAFIQGGTLGGTCVNVGCVPSKRMLVAGEMIKNTIEHNLGRGTLQSPHTEKFSFENLVRSKNQMVAILRKEKYDNVLKGISPNVDVYIGRGIFTSKNQIKVTTSDDKNRTIIAKNFLIATGSSPNVPRFKGIEDVSYWTNVEALSPPFHPATMIIIGGRALGLEFAQMYARLGTKVILLQRSKTIIPDEEPEISEALARFLKEDGINIITNVNIEKVYQVGKVNIRATKPKGSTSRNSEPMRTGQKTQTNRRIITVEASLNGKTSRFTAEALLLATGRKPNSSDLGLEELGVETRSGGAIEIDNGMRTNVSTIFAAGDVTGEPMLEGLAAREGTKAAENALTGSHKEIDFQTVPRAIFTDPQFATVGLTEKDAIEHGYECNCRVLNFSDVPKARIIGNTRGLIKMVADNKTMRVLGVHILCPNVSDFITEAALMIKSKYTLEDVVDTIHVFPTLSESIKIVAQSFFRDVGATSCCI